MHQGSFLFPGRSGNHHRVLVLPLLGPSFGYRTRQLPVNTRVLVLRQLLVALKGLRDAGLVHRGITPYSKARSGLSIFFLTKCKQT
jgi:hypothetical protein